MGMVLAGLAFVAADCRSAEEPTSNQSEALDVTGHMNLKSGYPQKIPVLGGN